MISEVDFTLYKDLAKTKIFTFTDKAGVAIDLSSLTNITLRASLDGFITTPINIVGAVSGAGNNVVTFIFAVGDTADVGYFEYLILKDYNLSTEDVLSGGNITVAVKEGFSTTLNTIINTETPAGLTITEDQKNTRIRYWRLYLQTAVTPTIADADLEDETAWDDLVNYLIAKLVIYDSLVLESKKAMISASGGGEGTMNGGGSLKKLETGPSNAEWWDSSELLFKMFKPDVNGNTPFDGLKQDLCQLSARVRVYLPICGQLSHNPIIPIKAGRPIDPDAIEILTNFSSNKPISQG
jgi:hypothetical protein